MQTVRLRFKHTYMDNPTGNQKPILLFVPHYIGSLKYFEKLLPFVSEKYEVVFFLSFVHERFFKETKDSAILSGRTIFAPEPPKLNSLIDWIPYVHFVRSLIRYRKDVLELLSNPRIKKVISVNDSGPYSRYLFKEAKARGIGTFVLQWAMSFDGARARKKKETTKSRKFMYRLGKPVYAKIKRKLINFVMGEEFSPSKDLIGRGNADKFGVINEQTKQFFLSQGVPEKKISVVGYLDFYLGQKTKEDFAKDTELRRVAATRLNINESKKNIVFFSSPYNGKDLNILSDAGQYEYTERIVKEIRSVCAESEYDILFKIHPSENIHLYAPLKKLGVKLFGKDTNNYELIYFADLYIAGGTATNFVPMIMDKPAIFVNFLNIKVVESTKNVFNIKEFMHDYMKFSEMLLSFKNGKLLRQYGDVQSIITLNSLDKIIDWIG